eukprot:TRINITY_DN3594_c0_g1_i2.p1 TRINITY_DN3594_c0_g1~~TRINITY_DN3594_c0_g1_i2.p1  ORF type:complete len:255 (+),score=32.08 TRINITY_DN3594_c0_g1_i2:262-1026(+)
MQTEQKTSGEPTFRKKFGVNFETKFHFAPPQTTSSASPLAPFKNFGFSSSPGLVVPISPWKPGQFGNHEDKNQPTTLQELQLPESFENQKTELIQKQQDNTPAVFKLPYDGTVSAQNIFEALQELMEKDGILTEPQVQALADKLAQKTENWQDREQEDGQRDGENMDVDGRDTDQNVNIRNRPADQNQVDDQPIQPRNRRPRCRGRRNRGRQNYKERAIREACGNNLALQDFMVTNLKIQQLFKGTPFHIVLES